MNEVLQPQGTVLIIRAFGGKLLRRRVWEDLGKSILVCKESEYQRSFQEGQEALCSEVPREDMVEMFVEAVADD